MEKTLDEIIKEINSGLTGDYKVDLKYIEEKSREYKDHEMGKEIVRACGRIMYEIIPEDVRAELNRAMEQDLRDDRAVIDAIRLTINNKEYDKALKMLEDYERNITEIDFYKNDTVSEYFQFDEFMQEVVYRFRNNPTKTIREAKGIPYCEIYSIYGCLLVELKRLEEARAMLKKGLRWNPLNFDMTMKYIETYKVGGDMDKVFDLTVEAFKIAIHPAQLGKCYRNLGYFFVEKKLYPEAVACYMMSDRFDRDSEQTRAELDLIRRITGQTFEPTDEDIEAYSKKYGFPLGADKDIVELANRYGKYFQEEKEYAGAKYCLDIANALTIHG